MALTIALDLDIASTRTTATITDNTVYGVGGNPARSAVGVFLTGYKTDINSNETALVVAGNNTDPETDTSWVITLSDEDGSYKFLFVIIPDYAGGTTYSQYQASFDPATNNVYRSLQNGNVGQSLSNTTYWELISDPSSLANNKDTSTESTNITSLVYLRVLSPNGQYEFANQLSEQCMCTDCDESEALNDYNIFAMWLDEIDIADSRSEVLKGELACRRIQSKFIDC